MIRLLFLCAQVSIKCNFLCCRFAFENFIVDYFRAQAQQSNEINAY